MHNDQFPDNQKLDNPVAFSLRETHQSFLSGQKGMLFYSPEYCPFGAGNPATIEGMNAYGKRVGQFYIVGDKPVHDQAITLEADLLCNQMILPHPIELTIREEIVPLASSHQKKELYELVQSIQPGYFQVNTVAMGNYYGVYRGATLVAACGERMKMNAYTEISAIVTHPSYRGLGLASQLIKHATDIVFGENKYPYLHVLQSNEGAIQLYKTLGFTTRRTIHFWKFKEIEQ